MAGVAAATAIAAATALAVMPAERAVMRAGLVVMRVAHADTLVAA
jgi:hypothetical protein